MANSSGETDVKAFLQNRLLPILVIIELITIILSFSDSLIKLISAIEENYYLVISLICITSFIFLYNSNFTRKYIKTILFIAIFILSILAISYRYWEYNLKKT